MLTQKGIKNKRRRRKLKNKYSYVSIHGEYVERILDFYRNNFE